VLPCSVTWPGLCYLHAVSAGLRGWSRLQARHRVLQTTTTDAREQNNTGLSTLYVGGPVIIMFVMPNGVSNIFCFLFVRDADLFAAGDMVVPATPGSMLKSSTYSGQSGSAIDTNSDWLTLQRQVAKLTCRVERLEEENGRRRQREYLLLYPLLFGYCIVQLARFLLSRSK